MPEMLPYVGFAGLMITLIGIGVKIILFMAELKFEMGEVRRERKHVAKIPMIDYRVTALERAAGTHITVPPAYMNGESHEE